MPRQNVPSDTTLLLRSVPAIDAPQLPIFPFVSSSILPVFPLLGITQDRRVLRKGEPRHGNETKREKEAKIRHHLCDAFVLEDSSWHDLCHSSFLFPFSFLISYFRRRVPPYALLIHQVFRTPFVSYTMQVLFCRVWKTRATYGTRFRILAETESYPVFWTSPSVLLLVSISFSFSCALYRVFPPFSFILFIVISALSTLYMNVSLYGGETAAFFCKLGQFVPLTSRYCHIALTVIVLLHCIITRIIAVLNLVHLSRSLYSGARKSLSLSQCKVLAPSLAVELGSEAVR